MSPEFSALLVLIILEKAGSSVRPMVTFNPNWDKIFTKESLTMTCNVSSPIPADMRYTWYKDNNWLHGGQSFVIQSATKYNSGNYQCKGTNTDKSDPVRLDVIHDYVILQAPLYVHEGDNVTLRCHHYPGYDGSQTIFYKDNSVIIDLGSDSELHIYNIDLAGSKGYKCTKRFGSSEFSGEASIPMKVIFTQPEMIMTPNQTTEGDNMTLTCDTRRSGLIPDTSLKFAFYRDGQNVQEFSLSNQYEVQSSQPKHSGNYSCKVRASTNKLTKSSEELYIQIQELFSQPEIEMIPDVVNKGNQMILTCNTIVTRNNTELQFAFYKNGQKIQEFSSSHQYAAPSVQLGDSGNYYCEVRASTNNLKKKSEELNVDIQGNTELFIILLPLALGMLLLVAILVTLFICSKRRSSVKPHEPTTGSNTSGDCDVQPEITYAILAMYPMPQDVSVTTYENHENNVVYAAMKPSSKRQPAADPECIYQNI